MTLVSYIIKAIRYKKSTGEQLLYNPTSHDPVLLKRQQTTNSSTSILISIDNSYKQLIHHLRQIFDNYVELKLPDDDP